MVYQAKEACDSLVVLELQKMLPKYMCPNRLVWLPRMPRNQKGKIDRVLLKRKYAGGGQKKELLPVFHGTASNLQDVF